jgi:thioredoxin 1
MKTLDLEDFKLLINSTLLQLVEFWSPLCQICSKAELYLEELERAYQNRFFASKIDLTIATQLIDIYSITKVPTFILFRNSIEVARTEGFREKTDIERMIRKNL